MKEEFGRGRSGGGAMEEELAGGLEEELLGIGGGGMEEESRLSLGRWDILGEVEESPGL